MLMLMPPYHGTGLRADENGMLQHFARVAEAARDSDHGAGRAAARASRCRCRSSCGSRARCRLVRYFKIEVPGAAAQAAQPDRGGRRRDRGTVRRRGIDHADGRSRRRRDRHDAERAAARSRSSRCSSITARAGATRPRRAYARILPLINYENRQCGLRATKTVMTAGGVIKSDAVRHPLEALHPTTQSGSRSSLPPEVDPLHCAGENNAA